MPTRDRRGHGIPPPCSAVLCWTRTEAGEGVPSPGRTGTTEGDIRTARSDPVERERILQLLLSERDEIVGLGPKHRQRAGASLR